MALPTEHTTERGERPDEVVERYPRLKRKGEQWVSGITNTEGGETNWYWLLTRKYTLTLVSPQGEELVVESGRRLEDLDGPLRNI